MKGCARYQNAVDHVTKDIRQVMKQIEATRQQTGGTDHTNFLSVAEKRLRHTWVSRLDVLKTRMSQEHATCEELKEVSIAVAALCARDRVSRVLWTWCRR